MGKLLFGVGLCLLGAGLFFVEPEGKALMALLAGSILTVLGAAIEEIQK